MVGAMAAPVSFHWSLDDHHCDGPPRCYRDMDDLVVLPLIGLMPQRPLHSAQYPVRQPKAFSTIGFKLRYSDHAELDSDIGHIERC